MRICYVGNYTRPWCTEVHVAASLQALGHEVIRFQENLVDWPTLPERISDAEGEALLWTRTWHVPAEVARPSLDRLRRSGLPMASFHLDRFLGLEREPLVDTEPFFQTDVLFTPDAGDWAAHGVTAVWCPPAIYHAEAETTYTPNPSRWPYDVVLVGSYPYPHPAWAPYRAETVNRLRKRYGRRFAVIPADLHAGRRGQAVRGAQLGELYATVPVVVGDSCLSGSPPPSRYWSDRIPETLGRGGYLVHPDVDGLADWYGDLGTYPLGDHDAMEAEVEAALYDPDLRQWKADASRQLVLKRDTYMHRMRVVTEWMARALAGEGAELPEFLPQVEIPTGALGQRELAGTVTPSGTVGLLGPADRFEPDGGVVDLGVDPPEPSPPAAPALIPEDRLRLVPEPMVPATVRFKGRRQLQATFLVAGGDSARHALDEVWTADNYDANSLGLSGATVLDVGANCGAFSVLAAKLGARHVHAYEPHPDTFQALAANADTSGVAARITCHQYGLATVWHVRGQGDDRGGRVLIGSGGGAHVMPADVGVEAGPDDHVVELRDFTAEVERVLLDAGAPDLVVKLDCEGAERELIAGLDPDLFRSIRAMVMEFHGPRMPHLAHLDVEGFGAMIVNLAEHGRLRIVGRPEWGGLLWWERYT